MMSKVTCYRERERVYYLNEEGLMYCFNDNVINFNFASGVCNIKRWSVQRWLQHSFELSPFQILGVLAFGDKTLVIHFNKRG